MNQNKTKPQTRSTSASLNGPAGNDTNKPLHKYRLIVSFEQFGTASIVIAAPSSAEAQVKALDLHAKDITQWLCFRDDVNIDSIEPVEGGQDHE